MPGYSIPGIGLNSWNNWGGFANTSLDDASDFQFWPGNPMSMTGSLFDGSGMFPGMGMPFNGSGMFPGMGMPFMPFMPGAGMDYSQYWDRMQDYYKGMTDANVKQRELTREADIKLNSKEEGVAVIAKNLKEKIVQDEQEQIMKVYKDYLQELKRLYPNSDEKDLKNRAIGTYASINKSDLNEDIRKYGKGSFTQGVLQTALFGFPDKYTAEDNIAAIHGLPKGRRAETQQKFGNAAGGAAVGAGAGLLLHKMTFKHPWLGAAMTAIGAAIGYFKPETFNLRQYFS